MRVVFDTNVLLDVLADRQPFAEVSASALDLARLGRVDGFVAAHAIATLAYLLTRDVGRGPARQILASLLVHLEIAPLTDAVIRRSLMSTLDDPEDAMVCAAAQGVDAGMIVTRNLRDFRGGPVSAVSPAEWVASVPFP
jgi:predicted nucleic acid-binding protein